MKKCFRFSWIMILVFLMSFAPIGQEQITVYLIGDSTMSIKEERAYPETGWGMPFSIFFNQTVKVDNRAKNGRSTRTFREEGLWQPVFDNLKKGDYVFVQFGHNDEVPTKKSYTTEEEFRNNLIRYVSETRSKAAVPVLLTPIARRKFNEAGRIEGTHEVYSQIVRDVANELNVAFIDMDKISQQLMQDFGVENSKWLFLHLAPGEHPNYPDGKEDNTHFSELGARKMAQLVLAEVKRLNLDLAQRIR